MLSGTVAMGLFPVAQPFLGGDSSVTLHRFRKTRHRQTRTSGDKVASTRILKFVSRAEHLAWRARWKNGRWVIRSPTPALRAAILRQDEEYRQADARWEQKTRTCSRWRKGAVVFGRAVLTL
jgi:hypothetical protein